jgi:hypothetical protein
MKMALTLARIPKRPPFTLCHRVLMSGLAFCMILNGSVANAENHEEAIYRHALRATAWVVTPTAQGTGFLVDRFHRFLITNQHVVQDHDVANVFFPIFNGDHAIGDRKHYIRYDRPIRGYVVARDRERDLAVVQLEVVPNSAAPLRISAAGAQTGHCVYLLGNPGLEKRLWVTNKGKVGRVGPETKRPNGQREVHALFAEIGVDAPVLPGCSGGPALNEEGSLVGVTTLSTGAVPKAAQARRAAGVAVASAACGPLHELACLGILAEQNLRVAFCIDSREVEDVIQMVRSNKDRASRLLDPRSAADYRDRGSYFLKKSRPDLAERSFREASRLDPRHQSPVLRP